MAVAAAVAAAASAVSMVITVVTVQVIAFSFCCRLMHTCSKYRMLDADSIVYVFPVRCGVALWLHLLHARFQYCLLP